MTNARRERSPSTSLLDHRLTSEWPFEWDKIDTRLCENETTEFLLAHVKGIDLIGSGCGGWGIIAEICKRLSRSNAGHDTRQQQNNEGGKTS